MRRDETPSIARNQDKTTHPNTLKNYPEPALDAEFHWDLQSGLQFQEIENIFVADDDGQKNRKNLKFFLTLKSLG